MDSEDVFVGTTAQSQASQNKDKPLSMASHLTPSKSKPSENKAFSAHGRNDSDEKDDSIFNEMLTKAGFILGKGDDPHKLKVDQVIFQRDLNQGFIIKITEVVINDFVREFKERMDDIKWLKKSLSPTLTDESCESARSHSQDSLVRLLLGVKKIQSKIAIFLLEKATILVYDEDGTDEAKSLPCTIFSQFRWTQINDEHVGAKLMEILTVLPLNLQKDLIGFLPEMLGFSYHNELAKKLSRLLMEKQELSVAIVDTFANLQINTEAFEEVKRTVLMSVKSAYPDDLPVLLNFLQQDLDALEAFLTVSELRASIDLGLDIPELSSTPVSNGGSLSQSSKKEIDILVLEVIIQYCVREKSIRNAWIKAIEKVKTASDHKTLDILVLIGLFPDERCRKYVEGVFRSKIKTGHFSASFVQKTFKRHPNFLREKLDIVLSLGNCFLRSMEPSIVEFGSSIYINAFISMENIHKREVVSSLINLISYGNIPAQNAGLDTLCTLVTKNAVALASFSNFINFLIDKLETFNLTQVRKVYFVLARIAFQGGDQGALGQDNLHIMIAKQLTNVKISYQKMGVIGCLMAAREISADQVNTDGSTLNASNISLNNLTSRRMSKHNPRSGLSTVAVSLLDILQNKDNVNPEVQGLFWDEIARAIQMGELSEKIENWVDVKIGSTFETEYIADYTPELKECLGTEIDICYNLEPLTEESIILNLTALVIKDDLLNKGELETRGGDNLSRTLSSHFRLLRMCVHFREEGNLEDIDALLVCGVTLPKTFNHDASDLNCLSTEKINLLCTATFHCINWFREIINAFAPINNEENRSKVVQRITNVIELQKKLQMFLLHYPDFKPPKANFDLNDVTPTSSASIVSISAPKKAAAAKPKKGRKRKLDGNDKENDPESTYVSLTALPTPSNPADKPMIKNGEVDLSFFRPFFRELDLTTFVLLECGLKVSSDKEKENEDESNCKLEPEHLEFLLDDLYLKLKHILPQSVGKRLSSLKTVNSRKDAGFSNLKLYSVTDVCGCMVNMLPSFCTLLEDCNGYFESLKENMNETSIDGDSGLDSDLTLTVARCMLYLINILNAILSWNGFNDIDHVEMLEQAMFKIGSRLTINLNAKASSVEKTKSCFGYLSKFEKGLPSLDCAVALVDLLETVAKHSLDEALKIKVSEMAEMFLQRHWKSASDIKDKGAKNNAKIDKLLEAYITYSSDVINCLEFLTNNPIEQLRNAEDRNAEVEDFPTLNKLSLPTYYSCVLKYLVKYIQGIENYRANSHDDAPAILAKWNKAAFVWKELVTLIKVFEGRPNLKACLVHSKRFLELFLRHCMPLLQAIFKDHTDDVLAFLRNIQQSTRFLQNCCYHTKQVLRDPAIAKHVPIIKKYFDMVLCDVKAILATNKCGDAFWVGILKTRTLKGEEIPDSEEELGGSDMEVDQNSSDSGGQSEDF